jgi:hypothetical protein
MDGNSYTEDELAEWHGRNYRDVWDSASPLGQDEQTAGAAEHNASAAQSTHALEDEEERTRDERDKARRDYYSTLDLEKQLKDSKRKMNDNEWWWLRELRSGRLRKKMQRAEGKCHRVQANDFVVNDDD